MNDKPDRMPNVPPFVKFVASAVPMVFDNSLSYYEALCALWKYIQGMTDVINNNATLEEEYIEKFNELKTFVDEYFDNLDVQEEINNKLDEMAEDGTLQEIITTYIQSNVAWTFDTVADMQASTNLVDGSFAQTLGFNSLGDGGAAIYKITDTGTVDNLNTFAVGSLYATAVNNGVKKISLAQLEQVGTGVYTLGKVRVNSAVQLPRVQNRGITIVNTTFELNTPVLFPAYDPESYFVLPNFIGCTFTNAYSGRVLIASGGDNIVASKITGCNFINVDMASGNMYLQDFNFAECYIQSYQAFLENNSTVQARFVNCSAESECKQIVKTTRFAGYFSGTYEGNEASNYYFVEAKYGDITLQNAWIEGTKFLTLIGGTTDLESSIINLNGSNIVASQAEMFHFDNASKVNLFINGTRWSAYNASSRLTNTLPSSFNSIIGSFISSNAPTYNYPIGGESILDKQYATEEMVNNLENKRFIQQFILLSNDVISSGGYNLTLPVGNYLMIWAKGADDVPASTDQIVAIVSGSDKNNSTLTNIIEINKGSGAYIGHTTFTATKANATDTTYTLNILPDSGYAHSGNISLIKIY